MTPEQLNTSMRVGLRPKFDAAEKARREDAAAIEAEREAGANVRRINAQIKQLTAQLEQAKVAKQAAKARVAELDAVTMGAIQEYWQAYDEVHGTNHAKSNTPKTAER
jgi:uncharacterized membrane protein